VVVRVIVEQEDGRWKGAGEPNATSDLRLV
jgi:hypothetical protein